MFANNWRSNTQKRGGYGTTMFGEADEGSMFAEETPVASGNHKIQ